MSKNLIIGQSGGPTAVINSSLAGAIDYALDCDEIGSVYGMINGIEGFLDENIMNLSNMFEHMPYELNRLKHRQCSSARADISCRAMRKNLQRLYPLCKNTI